MHELAVCQALLSQVEMVVARHEATRAKRIVVSVGPLSGVEPALLASAFTIARAGTVAADAELVIESANIVVKCQRCGQNSPAQSNRLVCGDCGDWRVRVIQGEELMLMRVELAGEIDQPAPVKRQKPEDQVNV